MIRRFFRIVTLLLVGAFCFVLGVYTGPTEPVVQLRAALEEQIASALQSLRAQTDKAKIRLLEATRPPQPAPTTSSAAAPAPAEAETDGKGAQAEGAKPGTVDSGESPSNAPPSAPQAAEPTAAAPIAAQPAPVGEPAPAPQAPVAPKANPRQKSKLPD